MLSRAFYLGIFSFIFLATNPVAAENEVHRQLAVSLLEATNVPAMLDQSVDDLLAAQLTSQKELRPYRDVLRSFYRKHMTWNAVQSDLVTLYVERFSAAELRQILSFYRSSVGKKLVREMPGLLRQANELGSARVQRNKSELARMIEAAQKKK